MANNYPIADLLADMNVGDTGRHVSDHKADRVAYNTLKAVVSAYGIAPLDLFAIGGTPSDKLDAAIAYCGGLVKSDGSGTQGVPTIQMGLGIYEFTRSFGQPYNGFRLEGVSRGQVHQKSTSTDNFQTRVKLTIPPVSGASYGYWLNVTSGQPFNYRIGGFNGFSDRSDCVVYRAPYISGTTTGVRESTFFEQTWQNVGVFGTVAEPFTITICDIIGGWGIFAPRAARTPVNLRGSDNRNIFGNGLDIYAVSTDGAGQYLFNVYYNGKTHMGQIYLTAAGTWQGMLIDTGTGSGLLDMAGAVLEGNNADDPCMGALLNVKSGNVSIRDTTIDDGMAAPANTASANGGTASRALVEIGSGAQVNLDTIAFAHANGVANTTPVIYNTSPKLSVGNLQTFSRGTAWGTQLPVIAGTAPRSANDGSWVQQ